MECQSTWILNHIILYSYNSLLTVITALALSSVKSNPSLTFPRHTAKNNAPSC